MADLENKAKEETGESPLFVEYAHKALEEHARIEQSFVPGYVSLISDIDVRVDIYRKTLRKDYDWLFDSTEDINEAYLYRVKVDELLNAINDLENTIEEGNGIETESFLDEETGVTHRATKGNQPISYSVKLERLDMGNGKGITAIEFLVWLAITAAEDEELKRRIYNSAYQTIEKAETDTTQSDSKKEAIAAGKIERRAASIHYENINGFETGYSEACTKLNDMLMDELDKEETKTVVEYTPKGWGATMRVTLPRKEVKAWKEAGGTPAQAQHLRAVIYELLKNEKESEWWKKQKTVTLTLGQIVRGMYPNTDKKLSDNEINLIARTMEMFIMCDLDSIYPEPTAKSKKAQSIDREILSIKGYRILPAVAVSETNARGHIVQAAYEFYALPPLEHQSSGIHHSLTIPVLDGLLKSGGKKANVTSQAYDLATVLGKYVRMAKDKGSVTVNYDTIMSDLQPEKYDQMKARIEAATFVGDTAEKKKAQAALRQFKNRTKKGIDVVMPKLIEAEATRERKPYYLAVRESGNSNGMTISVVKQTKDERTKHLKPRLYGYKIK